MDIVIKEVFAFAMENLYMNQMNQYQRIRQNCLIPHLEWLWQLNAQQEEWAFGICGFRQSYQ